MSRSGAASREKKAPDDVGRPEPGVWDMERPANSCWENWIMISRTRLLIPTGCAGVIASRI